MKSYMLFLIIWVSSISVLMAQENENNIPKKNNGMIEGIVLNKETQEPLAGVSVIVEGTQRGTVTESHGNFSIPNLAPGTYTLTFNYIGYAKERVENLKISQNVTTHIDVIQLTEKPIALSELVVTPGQFSIMGDEPLSRQTLTEKNIKNMSYAEDITRAVSRLPGIRSNDFSSKFTVRGGESDEVLMTLDGMELYEPFHQRDFAGGLFSIVDIETVQGIDLLTGGFSAEYGNRQSGVFNMKTKQIPEGEKHTSIGLSIMTARLYTDGTFAKNKGSYLVSVRRGMLDQTFKLVGQTERTPQFYDMMGKVQYALNDKHVLSFHALQAGDETAIRDVAPEAFDIHDTQYNNTYGWLMLKSFYNPKLFSRTLLFSGLISHNRNGSMDKYEYSDKLKFSVTDKRSYAFYGIKQDWHWDASDRLYLKSGFDIRQLNADYDYSYAINELRLNPDYTLNNYSNSFDFKSKPSEQQASAYLTGKLKALPKLFVETGIRHDYASYTEDNLLSPRISFAYSFSKNTFLRGAWGYYYQTQFINNLDVNHNVLTFNPAELSKHYVLGFEHLFHKGISLRLDGYYKDISRMSPTYQNLRDLWELFPESRNDEVRLDLDGATAKGIELFLKYDIGDKISWWFSYALARAEENITNIESNSVLIKKTGVLPRANNQLHTVYSDVNYRPNSKWHMNLSWQYYTGWPITIYTFDSKTLKKGDLDFKTVKDGDLHFSPAHREFRGEQSPDFHRMDIRINRYFKVGDGRISTYLHVINLYNRENLRKWDLDVVNDNEELVPDGNGGYIYTQDSTHWFGITPSLGVSWEF